MSEALTVKVPGALVASGQEWSAIQEQARTLIASGFFPKAVNTPAKAIAVMLAGRELGLPPMQSIRNINIVDGRPTIAAETMLALAYQRVPGLWCEVRSTMEGATVTGARTPSGKPVTVTFTKAHATAAGLLGKQNWRTYPEAMYRARAISAWCRVVAPDAVLGIYTAEEIESIGNGKPAQVIDISGAQEVTDTGGAEVLDDPRPTQEEAAQVEPGAQDGPRLPEIISEPQRRRLYAMSKKAQESNGWPDSALKDAMTALLKKHGFDSTTEITRDKYEAICDEVDSWK